MRHGKSGNRLSRNQSLRKATVRDMGKAVLIQERICTTKAKAKEGRKMVEQLITLGKKGTLADKRRAFAILCDHQLVSELFATIAPRFKNRVGGYTRIIPYGIRRGDSAELVYLELTEKTKNIISQVHLVGANRTAAVSTADEQDVSTVADAQVTEEESKAEEAVKKEKKAVKKEPAKKEAAPKAGGIKKFFKKKSEE